jgi:hypothetical protein
MKLETNKSERRKKLRGLEVAQAALLLVLGVAVALVLYFIMMDMVQATPVPSVQLDPYNSYISGTLAHVSLKFGKPATVVGMWIDNSMRHETLGGCWPDFGRSWPLRVNAGEQVEFWCGLADGKTWSSRMTIRILLDDGRNVNLQWVIG